MKNIKVNQATQCVVKSNAKHREASDNASCKLTQCIVFTQCVGNRDYLSEKAKCKHFGLVVGK